MAGGAFELGFNLSWAIGALASANWGQSVEQAAPGRFRRRTFDCG